MKKINKFSKIIGMLLFLIVIVMIIYLIVILIPKGKDVIEQEEVDKIKFDYVLYSRDTSLYKDIFSLLKDELNNDEINYDKYAEHVSKLFIIDLYTIDNKVSKNDVGGVQFVYDDIRDNFILNASNTLYKYVGVDNEIEWPILKKIDLMSIIENEYIIDEIKYSGYEVKLNWEYEKDLGYEKEGTIYLIKDKDELFVVEKK